MHTAHEAAWLNSFQGQAFDLTWLVEPGSIRAALLTGMLGLQPRPTVGEAAVYVIYAVPMLVYVLWPVGWTPRLPRRSERLTAEQVA